MGQSSPKGARLKAQLSSEGTAYSWGRKTENLKALFQ